MSEIPLHFLGILRGRGLHGPSGESPVGRDQDMTGVDKCPHLPTTRTVQEYTDEWRRQTPRDQLGFPKTR